MGRLHSSITIILDIRNPLLKKTVSSWWIPYLKCLEISECSEAASKWSSSKVKISEWKEDRLYLKEREQTPCPLPRYGHQFGGRDRTFKRRLWWGPFMHGVVKGSLLF